MDKIDFKIDEKYQYLQMGPPTVVDGVKTPNIKLKVFQCLTKMKTFMGIRYLFIDEHKVIHQCHRSVVMMRDGLGLFNMDNLIELREGRDLQVIFAPLADVESSFKKILKYGFLELPEIDFMEKSLKIIEEIKCNTK